MTRRGAHERPTRPHWPLRVAAVLAVVAVGWGLAHLLTSASGRDADPVAATTSASPSPSPVTVTEPMSHDQVRAAFITLAAQARGYALPAAEVPTLAQQTCSTIAAEHDADAVWRAAGDLEQPHGLAVGAAWEFVDLSVTTYCPEHHGLVLRTTAAMGD